MLVIVDQAIYSGSHFALTLLVSNWLGLEQFGVYASVLLGVYLAMSMLNAFVIQPAQTGLAKFDGKDYTYFLFVIQWIILVTVGFTLFFLPFIRVTYLGFALLFLGFDFHRKLNLAKGNVKHALKNDILWSATTFGLLLLVFVFQVEFTLNSVLLTLAASYLPAIVREWISLKYTKLHLKRFLPYHLQQGKWLVATALVQWWSSNLLVVASGLYLGLEALGVLRLVQSIFGVANLLLQTFENYVLPRVARLTVQHTAVAYKEIKKAMHLGYLFFVPVFVVAYVYSAEILTFITGKEMSEFKTVIRAFVVLYFLILINQPIRILIRSLELNQLFFWGYVVGLLFNLAFAKLLIQNFGLQGVLGGLISIQALMIGLWSTLLIIKKQPIWKSYI